MQNFFLRKIKKLLIKSNIATQLINKRKKKKSYILVVSFVLQYDLSRVRLPEPLIFFLEDYTNTGHFLACNPIVIHSDIERFRGEKNPENPVIPDGQE